MGVATEATDFEIAIPGVQRVTERRRRLRRPLVAEHAHVPGLTGKPVSPFAGLLGSLRRRPDRGAIDRLPRLGGHTVRMRPLRPLRQAATACGWLGRATARNPHARRNLSPNELLEFDLHR